MTSNSVICSVLCAVICVSVVYGHITISPSYYAPNLSGYFWLNIPHGCGAYGTEYVVAILPAEFISVTPENKSDWTILKTYVNDSYAFGGGAFGDNKLHWQLEWSTPPGTSMPATTLTRLGFSSKTPAGVVGSKYFFPTWQRCTNGVYGNYSYVSKHGEATPLGLEPASSLQLIDPPTINGTFIGQSIGFTIGGVGSGSGSGSSGQIVTTQTVVTTPSDNWSYSDKLATASIIISSIMFVGALLLFHFTNFSSPSSSSPHSAAFSPYKRNVSAYNQKQLGVPASSMASAASSVNETKKKKLDCCAASDAKEAVEMKTLGDEPAHTDGAITVHTDYSD